MKLRLSSVSTAPGEPETVNGSAADVALREALVHLLQGMVGCPHFLVLAPMPHKHNDDRRHHIPKMAFKVRNWPEYEAGLRRRGSLTLWIEDAALEQWQTVGPTGEARYSDAAIQTTLMVRAAFRLAFRQTEGLMA